MRRERAFEVSHEIPVKDTRRLFRAPYAPSTGALVLFWFALTPSLLQRSPIFQGVVCALAAFAGYGSGALLGWIVRGSGVRLTGRVRRLTWQLTAAVALVGTVAALWVYLRWENDLRKMVGVEEKGVGALISMLLVAAVLFVALVAIARALKGAGRIVGRKAGHVLPPRVATVVGGLIVALGAYTLVTGVATDRLLAHLDSTFIAINDEFRADLPTPTSPYLSAGPRSNESWDDLGRQGRVFIANAPTAAAIQSFSGRSALQPVRAYVGVGTDGEIDLRQEANRAVEELERAGGFDRAVINVAIGTGRGWVNENQVRALEYLWDGDTATVSMQYSYLPSWMSFLVDGGRAQDAGRLLFDAVYARWSALPTQTRPTLVVSGESLGSFGGEAAFSGSQDLANRTRGALFVGPTNNNTLWSRFTAERDTDTPQVLPQYEGGATVRFADQLTDWDTPGNSWSEPRIGYLQHANDPITWWNWSLALSKPDWLREPRGRDVSPSIRWIPGITMLQLAADQMVANDVPAGQGHQFGQEPVFAWAAILPPRDWTDDETDRLATTIKRLETTIID